MIILLFYVNVMAVESFFWYHMIYLFKTFFFLTKVNEIKEMQTFHMQHFCKCDFGYFRESQEQEGLILLSCYQETTKVCWH